MAEDDDNSQDYEGYKHTAFDDLTEESATSNRDEAPNLTEEPPKEGEEEEEEEESDDESADGRARPGGDIDTGITEEDEKAMGLRDADGNPVPLPSDESGQLDEDSEGRRGGSDEAANNPGLNNNDSGAPDAPSGSAVKDPKDWTTGDEPATPAQMSYISTMAVEAHEEVPTELTKAEASEKINELQQKTGRDASTERP